MFAETIDQSFAMGVDAADQIAGHSDVQRSSRSARQDVDPIGHESMMDCGPYDGNRELMKCNEVARRNKFVCAGLTRASIFLRKGSFEVERDCRVKPGNDELVDGLAETPSVVW